MSNALIALFFAGGAGAWTYAKFNRSTGNNTKSAGIAAAASALLIFVLMYFILGLIVKK
jgi:hypothetical protein